jgi:hypothetical protein
MRYGHGRFPLFGFLGDGNGNAKLFRRDLVGWKGYVGWDGIRSEGVIFRWNSDFFYVWLYCTYTICVYKDGRRERRKRKSKDTVFFVTYYIARCPSFFQHLKCEISIELFIRPCPLFLL